jgi:hypothetical protein
MNKSIQLPASFVQSNGIKGTYITADGGVGLGYEMTVDNGLASESVIVRSGGNGFYYPVDNLFNFTPDNGKGYMAKVSGLALPPAYKS